MIVQKFKTYLIKSAEDSEYQFVTFGFFGLISYPAYYFFWTNISQGYENLLVRLIAGFLCIPLIFKDHWPSQLKPFLYFYWYIVFLYCLPLFFTFMLFKNDFSSLWELNTMSGLVWGVLIMEAGALLIIILLGVPLGWLAYYLSTAHPSFPLNSTGILVMYFSVLCFSALFSIKKERFRQEKLETMRSLGASLAHEIRTPLASIHANIVGMKDYWGELLTTYRIAKEAKLSVPSIRTSQFNLLENSFYRIQREVDFSNLVINMLLANVDLGKLRNISLEECSIRDCIHQALDRYPFVDAERNLIQWEENQDFLFKGKALLVIHVLFNLIKNSLYHIKAADKGDIRIFLGFTKQYNQVHFLDTGAGISVQTLSRIFEPFFSAARHGSGIGLTFCREVMRLFDGVIHCQSVEGEYTKFILNFPKI